MNITVIGCGRWGSCIAWYLDKINHKVKLYGKSDSFHMQKLLSERRNEYIEIPESITLETKLAHAVDADALIISINSQGLRELCCELKEYDIKGKPIILCMKGLEGGTAKRLSEVVEDELGSETKVAVWVGPGHVEEFYGGIPNCMVIDSKDDELKRMLVKEFSGDIIRFYYGTDIIGNEIGAASKNVIGIAAGMLDGMGLTSLKGALMSRGTREIARLIKASGGNELSAYGLCHLGDYQATVFSKYSHNRQYGEDFIKGKKFDKLAEGYYTVPALVKLAEKNGVEIPICRAVYEVLYCGKDPKSTLHALFERSVKEEY
ncbi:MAG: NAD(P)H-dependent glycerol-3-phosphate dehydrogenase [Clostridiales bacterium]|nr:NAD(P)H-dependent glycerol-3-phosphate dehydrogenase [Clostridiales bacterium]